jgi:hypothetical protein
MNDEKLLKDLEWVANVLESQNEEFAEIVVARAMDRIRQQNAALAVQAAEIERLKPREMTLTMRECRDVFNARRFLDSDRWQNDDDYSVYLSKVSRDHILYPEEARYIAQGLLRDGGEGGGA